MTHLSFKEKKDILFGGSGTKFLILSWLGSLLFFTWLFSDAHIEGFMLSFNSTAKVEGYVTDMEFTNVTSNDVAIYKIWYSFAVDGQVFTGVSYDGGYYDIDNKVYIEYLPDYPFTSRIQGSDKTLSGAGFTTIAFLLLAGLSIWVFFRFRKRFFEINIVSNGIVVGSNLIDKVMTNTTINDRTLFKLFYEYEAKRDKYQVVEQTTYPENFRDNERIVYHQNKPSKGILMNKLPNDVQRKLIKGK